MNTIKELLHKSFSNDAIFSAAICEQLEDVSYCSKHGMNHMNGGKEDAKCKITSVDLTGDKTIIRMKGINYVQQKAERLYSVTWSET